MYDACPFIRFNLMFYFIQQYVFLYWYITYSSEYIKICKDKTESFFLIYNFLPLS